MNGASGERKARPGDYPRVLQCLFEEHRHLSALVSVLEEKTAPRRRLELADYYLLRDIVGYLHDYPDAVHHPTENLLFEKLVRREPSVGDKVKRLLQDHEDVSKETGHLLALLDDAIEQQTPGDTAGLKAACRRFARHQRTHMGFENREIFPVAIDSLARSDWREIEARFAAVDDPLFGPAVGRNHRLLYEYLLNPADRTRGKLARSGLFTQERLMLTADLLSKGVEAWCNRLGAMGDEVSAETRSAVENLVGPFNARTVVATPFRYSMQLGKSLLYCSGDLAGIYVDTARQALALYKPRFFR